MQVFRPRTAPEAIKLVEKLLEYTPEARLSAVEAMCHPFFDELRNEDTRLQPQDKPLPRLFDFTREGEANLIHLSLRRYSMCHYRAFYPS